VFSAGPSLANIRAAARAAAGAPALACETRRPADSLCCFKDMKKLAIHGGDPVRKQPYPSWPAANGKELSLIEEVLRSGNWGGHHPFVGQFERLFARLHDCEHGIAAATGTLALELALEAAGVGAGDEVIVPAHSFISTASAVSRVGAEPVFVDIDPETYNIHPARIEEAGSDRTSAVMVVHFGGAMADMDRIREIAAARDWTVIEDAAHAHGAEWHGSRAGSLGKAGVFSFQNSKVMTAGEGGILVTNDGELAARARAILDCGRRPGGAWFEHYELSSNYRLGGLQAAVLLAQLEQLAAQNRTRQQNGDYLLQAVETPGVIFQKPPDGAVVKPFYLLPGRIDETQFGATRDDFVEAMNAEGVPCRPFYPHPLYTNPMYRDLPHRKMPCPAAEQACKDSFWLPHRVLLGDQDDTNHILRAIDKIHDVYRPVKRGSKAN